MDHVDRCARLATQGYEQTNGFVLPGRRPRREIGAIGVWIPEDRRGVTLQFGVDEQRLAALGQDGQGHTEGVLVHGAKLLDPRRHQESLEAGDTRVHEAGQLSSVARDDAAPEGAVHEDPAPSRLALGLESDDRRGGGNAVEGHVDQGGDAARRRGARGRVEALPLGPSRLVDVDVGVDQAGHQDAVARVEHLHPCRGRAGRRHRLDLSFADPDVRGTHALRGDGPGTANDQRLRAPRAGRTCRDAGLGRTARSLVPRRSGRG